MSALTPRYFELKLTGGKLIEVEPPKLKVLRKIMGLSQSGDADADTDRLRVLADALAMALSKNRQGKKLDADWVEDNFNMIEIQELLISYFQWIAEIQSSKN